MKESICGVWGIPNEILKIPLNSALSRNSFNTLFNALSSLLRVSKPSSVCPLPNQQLYRNLICQRNGQNGFSRYGLSYVGSWFDGVENGIK